MKLRVFTTGGTIAKTYDEAEGALRANGPVIETLLARLRLPDLDLEFDHLFSKDSLEMTDDDRGVVIEAVKRACEEVDAAIVIHGTDTMETTGNLLFNELPDVRIPIILTGAMRPYEFRDTDALQSLTEALLASRMVAPGVYVVIHNRILKFPGVVKDRKALSFKRLADGSESSYQVGSSTTGKNAN